MASILLAVKSSPKSLRGAGMSLVFNGNSGYPADIHVYTPKHTPTDTHIDSLTHTQQRGMLTQGC